MKDTAEARGCEDFRYKARGGTAGEHYRQHTRGGRCCRYGRRERFAAPTRKLSGERRIQRKRTNRIGAQREQGAFPTAPQDPASGIGYARLRAGSRGNVFFRARRARAVRRAHHLIPSVQTGAAAPTVERQDGTRTARRVERRARIMKLLGRLRSGCASLHREQKRVGVRLCFLLLGVLFGGARCLFDTRPIGIALLAASGGQTLFVFREYLFRC